jgi:hypothetical protein
MLKFIFYSFSVLAVLYELWAIRNSHKIQKVKQILDDVKGVDYSNLNGEQKSQVGKSCIFAVFHFMYFFWNVVGLMSSQWILFLLILIFGILSSYVFKRNKAWHTTDCILSMSIIVFAVINTYHLHIDLFDVIYKYIMG